MCVCVCVCVCMCVYGGVKAYELSIYLHGFETLL